MKSLNIFHVTNNIAQELIECINLPKSIGRHKEHDKNDVFGSDLLNDYYEFMAKINLAKVEK